MPGHMRLPPHSSPRRRAARPAAPSPSGCGESDRAGRAARHRTPAPPNLQQRLDAVVGAGSPGVISLVNDGRTVKARAAGVADLRSKRPLRPQDRFRAGSITKSFVAAVALQLVGEGKLSLSDTVEHWLPGILPYGDKVNVRQLLNLTSGVPDDQLPVNIAIYRGDKLHAWTPRELVELVADKPQEFPAGKGWAYSNTNYALAGMIIERAARHSLAPRAPAAHLRPAAAARHVVPRQPARARGQPLERLLARLRRLLRADRGQAARPHRVQPVRDLGGRQPRVHRGRHRALLARRCSAASCSRPRSWPR